jgi:inhibitor of cysteine peptidase
MIQAGAAQSGSEIEVRIGDVLNLRLFENPASGYRWRITSSGAPGLALAEDHFQMQSAGAVGTGGIHEWRFRAAQAGGGTLKMEYVRAWEPLAIDTFSLKVRVKSRE